MAPPDEPPTQSVVVSKQWEYLLSEQLSSFSSIRPGDRSTSVVGALQALLTETA
jgi:hypothetical protein